MPLRGTPTWRFHTELYKFQSNVSANNSTTEYHTDLRLGEVVYLCILYNITNSWLLSSTGFDFNILRIYKRNENRILRRCNFCPKLEKPLPIFQDLL